MTMETDELHPQPKEKGFTKWLHHFSARIQETISAYFGWHGAFISRYPCATIIASLIVSITFTVLYFKIMAREADSKDLFTPNTAKSFKDKDYYEHFYGKPPSQTRMLATRNVDLKKERDCHQRSLLADDMEAHKYLQELFHFYYMTMNLAIEYKGKTYSTSDLCLKPVEGGFCQVTSVLGAWGYDESVMLADATPTATLYEHRADQFGFPLNISALLGVSNNPNPNHCPGNVEAFQTFFIMKYEAVQINGEHYDPKLRKWNEALVTMIKKESKNSILSFYVNSLDAINKESLETLEKDQRLLWYACFLVLIYCHVALFKNSYSQCKTHLAIITCLSVAMAIYSSYGIAQVFGIKYNPVHRVLPFLLMGLGVDDTFVILSAYHSTDVSLPVNDRMRITSMRAGSAILVTSATAFLAFLAGMFTSLNALRDFSIYAALGIIMDFIYQITFFLAFLALDCGREYRKYNSLQRQDNEANDLHQPLNHNFHFHPLGDVDDHQTLTPSLTGDDSEAYLPAMYEESSITSESSYQRTHTVFERKIFGSGYYTPRPNAASVLAGKWLPKLTLNPVGKTMVLIIELIVISIAIVGCTKVKMDFMFEEWFVADGSDLQKASNLEKTYFRGNQIPFHALTKELTPGDHFRHQHELLNFAQSVRADPHVARNIPIRSWFVSFIRYCQISNLQVEIKDGVLTNETEFLAYLRHFLDAEGQFYKSDVIFDPTRTQILSSRFTGFTENIKSGSYAVHTVDSLRHTVESVAPDLHPVVYSYGFLYYDGFRVIAWETTRNVMLAGAAVFIMTLLTLANLSASISVLMMVVLTDIMLFGSMWYLDLTFNSVTCICMVLAVGIAVDYSVHIAHTFLVTDGSRQERAEKSLHIIGGAVLNGAFTTLLAVLVLGFAKHYILQTFFKMLFGIIICGAWHGLVVLPIVLSFLGPKEYFLHE